MKELVDRIEAAVAKYRLTFGNESELQGQLAEVLSHEGIVFEREFVVSAGERPDFWVQDLLRPRPPLLPTGIAIEVKVGGSAETHLRQMKRYNDHPRISGTILIGTRKYDLPETLSGKPVACISIGGNRL
jgi:hypothetical protein